MKGNNLPSAEKMRELAHLLDEIFNPTGVRNIGFALLTFKTNQSSMVNYIGNCQRGDMLKAFKELIAKWESGQTFNTPEDN